MPCGLCGSHANIDVCKRCRNCDYAHQMKFGVDWKETKITSNEPCPQIARFELPNKNWLTYKCTKKLGHEGACDFGVDPKQVERIARDTVSGGGR